MVVHKIISAAHHREHRAGKHVRIGENTLDPLFPQKLHHLPRPAAVRFEQKRAVKPFPPCRVRRFFNRPIFKPRPERFPVLTLHEFRSGGGLVDVPLVDDVERNQHRIILERQPGMRVHMVQERPAILFPVLEHRIPDPEEPLVLPERDHPVRKLRNLPPARHPRNVEIRGNINPALLQRRDQILELIHPLRLEPGAHRIRERLVVVVDPDQIEAARRHPVGEPVSLFPVQIKRSSADVRSVKTDRHLRAVAENQLVAAPDQRTVLPRRCVKRVGKIENRPSPNHLVERDLPPLLPRDDEVRRLLEPRQIPAAHRRRDNPPDRSPRRMEFDPRKWTLPERETRPEQPDIRRGVLRRPDHLPVRTGGRSPPVADLTPAAHLECVCRAVPVDDLDAADLTPRPCDRMQQIKPGTRDFPRNVAHGLFRKRGPRTACEHDAALPAVLFRIDDCERKPIHDLRSGFEHAQIVRRALIGPAAFAVPGGRVGETGVHDFPQIERRIPAGAVLQRQVQRRGGDLPVPGRHPDPDRVVRLIVRPVILNVQFEVAAQRNRTIPRRNLQYRGPLLKEHSRFLLPGKLKRLPVDLQLDSGIFVDRQPGFKTEGCELRRF